MGMEGFPGSGPLIVDKTLGNAYQIVRHVRENLVAITAVAGLTEEIALIAANLAQAEDAILNNQIAVVLGGVSNFRATFAEALIDFGVNEYFTTAESGALRLYQRTLGGLGYTDQGDLVAPVSRALLALSSGADLIGSTGDISVQDALDVRPTVTTLAEDAAAASIGSALGSNVQADLNARPTVEDLADDAAAGTIGLTSVAGTDVAAAINNMIMPFVSLAVLGNIASTINTTGKFQGKQIFCTDNNKVYVASGAGVPDIWWSVDGLDSNTPVAI